MVCYGMLSWPSIIPSRSLSRHRIIFWDVLFLIRSLTVCLWRSWLFQVQGLFRSGILSAISMSFTRVTLYSCTRSEHRSAQWSWLSLLKIRAGFFFFLFCLSTLWVPPRCGDEHCLYLSLSRIHRSIYHPLQRPSLSLSSNI